MIVIMVIAILLWLWVLPYRYYIDRGYTEKAADIVAQEWVLAHKAVRNGILFDQDKHAHIVMIFEKGSNKIQEYLLSWSQVEIESISSNPNIKPYRTTIMDGGVKLQYFTGWLSWDDEMVGYIISPPFASGAFFTGSSDTSVSLMDASITVGHDGAQLDGNRMRKILLRPHLQ